MSDIPLIGTPQQPELRRMDDLTPYENNSRTHSEEQIDELAASIEEFGMVGAIVVRGGTIAKGHGTLEGCRKLFKEGKPIYPAPGAAAGAKPYPVGTVPVLDVSGWSDTQFRAYVIADNKLALNAGWDVKLLKVELADLQVQGFDLAITGFHQDELDELFKIIPPPPEVDPDATPEPPEVAHSVPGDVWICGPHKIMCGDSLKVEDWERLMGTERADIIWTDPPYNVDIGGKNQGLDKADGGKRAKSGGIKNDAMSDAKFLDFLCNAFITMYTVAKPGAAIYVAHPDREGHNFHNAFRNAGFKFSGCVVWKKNSMVLGLTDYQNIHEPILYGWKPGASHRWFGGRKLTTVVDYAGDSPFTLQEDGRYAVQIGDEVLLIDGQAQVERLANCTSVIYHAKPSRSEKHPTTKPVGLITKLLVNNARRNDIVVDAFNGSGSTLIAAEQCGMCYRGMELDPRFVDVTCQRYYEFTGRTPVHAVTGEPFPVQELPPAES